MWIWTSNPSEKLEVNGTGKFTNIETTNSAKIDNSSIEKHSTIVTYLLNNPVYAFWLKFKSSYFIFEPTSSFWKIWVQINNNLWIWTEATPNYALNVSWNSLFSGNISAKTGYFSEIYASDNIILQSGTIYAMTGWFERIRLYVDWHNGVIETQYKAPNNYGLLFKIGNNKTFTFTIWNNEHVTINTDGINITGSLTTTDTIIANNWWLKIWSDTCSWYDDVWKLAIINTGDSQNCTQQSNMFCATQELVICSSKNKDTETERKTISTIYKNHMSALGGGGLGDDLQQP